MSLFSYYNPVNIVFDTTWSETVPQLLRDRTPLVVTSPFFSKREDVQAFLSSGNQWPVVLDVSPNPTLDDLSLLFHQKWAPFDVIVAIGGGSVLDIAKGISLFHAFQDFSDFLALIQSNQKISVSHAIPIIGIPTTAGTSSELTPWATMWDTTGYAKYSIYSDSIWCESAVYDAQLMVSMSRDLTIQTALDALSHSLESIWNRNASDLTRLYAKQAIQLMLHNIPLLMSDLSNISLRKQMMLASIYSGLAMSNTQTAILHAFSYYLTLHYQIPHGISCSFLIPRMVSLIKESDPVLMQHLEAIDPEIDVKLSALFELLNVSQNLYDYGVSASDFSDMRSAILSNNRIQNSLVSSAQFLDKVGVN